MRTTARISSIVVLYLFFMFSSNTFAFGHSFFVWVVKNDNSIWYGRGDVTGDYPEYVRFSQVQGWASAVTRSPLNSSPEIGTNGQIWVVGGGNSLWRIEDNIGWVNHDIYTGGIRRNAFDIASLRAYNGSVFVWAIGDMVNGNNIYSYNNSNGTWSLNQGSAIKIDLCETTNMPWVINGGGDVWELQSSGGWTRRGYGSQQKAIDIGCGSIYPQQSFYEVFIATDQGKLMQYNGATSWTVNADFAATGKSAKAVDASMDIAAVATTDGKLYFVKADHLCCYHWARLNENIDNVKDVALWVEPQTGIQ